MHREENYSENGLSSGDLVNESGDSILVHWDNSDLAMQSRMDVYG